eukprot:5181272-Pyramimonas_sp.AAC.1
MHDPRFSNPPARPRRLGPPSRRARYGSAHPICPSGSTTCLLLLAPILLMSFVLHSFHSPFHPSSLPLFKGLH